jgi:hypothetical protein
MLNSCSLLVVSHCYRFRDRDRVPDHEYHDHRCYHDGVRRPMSRLRPRPWYLIGQGQVSTWRERHMYGYRNVQSVSTPPPVSILLERIPDWAIKHSCILIHVTTGTTPDRNTIAQGTSRVGLVTRPDGRIAESYCSTHSLTYSLARVYTTDHPVKRLCVIYVCVTNRTLIVCNSARLSASTFIVRV